MINNAKKNFPQFEFVVGDVLDTSAMLSHLLAAVKSMPLPVLPSAAPSARAAGDIQPPPLGGAAATGPRNCSLIL